MPVRLGLVRAPHLLVAGACRQRGSAVLLRRPPRRASIRPCNGSSSRHWAANGCSQVSCPLEGRRLHEQANRGPARSHARPTQALPPPCCVPDPLLQNTLASAAGTFGSPLQHSRTHDLLTWSFVYTRHLADHRTAPCGAPASCTRTVRLTSCSPCGATHGTRFFLPAEWIASLLARCCSGRAATGGLMGQLASARHRAAGRRCPRPSVRPPGGALIDVGVPASTGPPG
jgi:hypothetical protein